MWRLYRMKLCKPSYEIWEQEPGIQGIYKAIERAGRICYLSEDKITEDSAKPFVDRMVSAGHHAMLEHGTVYLYVPYDYYNTPEDIEELEEFYMTNPYSKVNPVMNFDCGYPAQGDRGMELYISTNYRVLVEHNRLDDLKYLCEPTEYHERRITVHFVCDRGVSHEFVRHKLCAA